MSVGTVIAVFEENQPPTAKARAVGRRSRPKHYAAKFFRKFGWGEQLPDFFVEVFATENWSLIGVPRWKILSLHYTSYLISNLSARCKYEFFVES